MSPVKGDLVHLMQLLEGKKNAVIYNIVTFFPVKNQLRLALDDILKIKLKVVGYECDLKGVALRQALCTDELHNPESVGFHGIGVKRKSFGGQIVHKNLLLYPRFLIRDYLRCTAPVRINEVHDDLAFGGDLLAGAGLCY